MLFDRLRPETSSFHPCIAELSILNSRNEKVYEVDATFSDLLVSLSALASTIPALGAAAALLHAEQEDRAMGEAQDAGAEGTATSALHASGGSGGDVGENPGFQIELSKTEVRTPNKLALVWGKKRRRLA